jgi:copper chaperone CopZ
MKAYSLDIRGMTCEHCVATVRKALEALPGVERVNVDLAGSRAGVVLDETRARLPALLEAVRQAGYTAPSFREVPQETTP